MTHESYMRECLRLAQRGAGRVSPNPMVGALIVRGGKIIARGYHRRFGGPHAEIECLSRASGDLSRATMYVNLEPCSHHGKTPPCVDALRASGLRSVVIAMRDPNPLVEGKGVRLLRRWGFQVMEGLLEQEAAELNRVFVTHIERQRPYIHVKIARSLDGFIAPRGGRRHWLTSRSAQELVHRWRSEHDAILVGAGTVAADDPELNVRLVRGRNPLVAILDGRLRVPVAARMFDTGSRIFIFSSENTFNRKRRKVEQLVSKGAVVVGLRSSTDRIPLRRVLRELHRLNCGSVLVEGGAHVFSSFMRAGLVDRLSVFTAPVRLRKGIPTFHVSRTEARGRTPAVREGGIRVQKIGPDTLLQLDFS